MNRGADRSMLRVSIALAVAIVAMPELGHSDETPKSYRRFEGDSERAELAAERDASKLLSRIGIVKSDSLSPGDEFDFILRDRALARLIELLDTKPRDEAATFCKQLSDDSLDVLEETLRADLKSGLRLISTPAELAAAEAEAAKHSPQKSPYVVNSMAAFLLARYAPDHLWRHEDRLRTMVAALSRAESSAGADPQLLYAQLLVKRTYSPLFWATLYRIHLTTSDTPIPRAAAWDAAVVSRPLPRSTFVAEAAKGRPIRDDEVLLTVEILVQMPSASVANDEAWLAELREVARVSTAAESVKR